MENTNSIIATEESRNYPAIFDLSEFPQKGYGRPIVIKPALVKQIIDEYAVSKGTITDICRKFGCKHHEAVLNAIHQNIQISEYYDSAQRQHAEIWADECMEIADDSSGDLIEGKYGPAPNNAAVRRSEVRIKMRQWLMERVHRKKYGDKQEIEVNQTNRNVNIDITPGKFDSMDISDACQIFTQK